MRDAAFKCKRERKKLYKVKVIVDSIQEIIDRADEAKKQWENDKSDDLEFGRLLAFSEVLSILKTDFQGEEVGKILDFDIDKRYTCS